MKVDTGSCYLWHIRLTAYNLPTTWTYLRNSRFPNYNSHVILHPLSVHLIWKCLMTKSTCLEVKIASARCVPRIQNEHLWRLLYLHKCTVTCQSSVGMQMWSILAVSAQHTVVVVFFQSHFFPFMPVLLRQEGDFVSLHSAYCFKCFREIRTSAYWIYSNLLLFLSSQGLVVIRQLNCWDQFFF